jgi:hypothetical protein
MSSCPVLDPHFAAACGHLGLKADAGSWNGCYGDAEDDERKEDQDMLASVDVDRQPSISVGIFWLAALVAIFLAGVLVDPSFIRNVVWLWHRGSELLFDVSRFPVTVPSCPDPGASWWFQGTLLCTN